MRAMVFGALAGKAAGLVVTGVAGAVAYDGVKRVVRGPVIRRAAVAVTEERHIAIPPHEECEVLLGQGMRVHDGTNDAPAPALAEIGIAMGVGGTDVAVETADVALAGDDLRGLLELRDLGRRTIGLIGGNYGMSIAVNAAGLLVSAGGAMSPVVAAILHNASSVAVVANSSRLIRYRLAG